jgi:serine/threonine-protein kinase
VTGATTATVAVPGLALADPQTTVDRVESTGTGVATVSEMRAPRRKRRASVVRATSLIGVAAVIGVVLVIRATSGHTPDPSESAAATPHSAQPEPAAPSPSSAPAAPALASATPALSEPAVAHPSSPDVSRKRVAPAAHPRSVCATPYTLDARGLRHYKPECI